MLTPLLPTVVGWWTIPDTHWTFVCEKPISIAGLDTLNPVRLAPTVLPYPIQRHLNLLSCPFTLNGSLSQGLEILLWHFPAVYDQNNLWPHGWNVNYFHNSKQKSGVSQTVIFQSSVMCI